MWTAVGLLALGLIVLAGLGLCFVLDIYARLDAAEADLALIRDLLCDARTPHPHRAPELTVVGLDPFHPDGIGAEEHP